MLDILLEIKEYHSVNGLKNPLKINGHRVPSAYYNGLLSFGYEQMGFLSKAEEVAMEGLQYYEDDNWLQHCLIHSRYFQENNESDLQRLIEYILEHAAPHWDIEQKHAFMTTHSWWHIGLLYLELDQVDKAMDIFKTHIWRKGLDRRADQIGALSMFWILNMVIDSKSDSENDIDYSHYLKMKEEIESLWESVMDYVYDTNQSVDVGYKLYDLLFIRGVIEMKARYKGKDEGKYQKFQKYFEKKRREMVEFCGEDEEMKQKYIGLVAAMELMYGENVNERSLQSAYEIMSEIVWDLDVIGGSREQRFVFDQMYIDLLIKDHRPKELKEFLNSFLAKYPLKSLELVAANMS